MTRFIEFIIALLIVVALFALLGVLLPSSRHVEHSIETNHPIRQVYDTLSGFERFPDWHPLGQRDPRIQYEVAGEARGEGATLRFSSADPAIGEGSFEIIEADPDTAVVMEATNNQYGDNKIHRFEIEEVGKNVRIIWSYDVDYGWNLFGRYAGLYVTRTVGDQIKAGLANLAGLIATMPNFDYSKLEVSKQWLQPENILYATRSADRNITAVQAAMDEGLTAIRSAISANGLEATGPFRLITTNFGDEKYEFDVAIPVRAPAAAGEEPAEAQTEDAADGDEAVAADEDGAPFGEGPGAAPLVVDVCEGKTLEPAPALPQLRLPDNVKHGTSYGGCALMADYVGHPAALPLVRDMLRSYAASHGLQIHDRAFEKYLTPMDEADATGQAEFHVYWPVVPKKKLRSK